MSKGSAYVASRLPEIVGAEHVLTDIAACAKYEVDGVRPWVVVRPGRPAGIVEILRFAAADGLAVIPMGGRTQLGLICRPQAAAGHRATIPAAGAGVCRPCHTGRHCRGRRGFAIAPRIWQRPRISAGDGVYYRGRGVL